MNDRFKFRVWDKRRNKFIESPESTPMLQANGLLAYFKDAKYMNNYVVQFCTGLKDKNGKLIYEGDIVKETLTDFINEEIIIVVKWDNLNASYNLENLQNCEREVIGNIYENKSLLESEG